MNNQQAFQGNAALVPQAPMSGPASIKPQAPEPPTAPPTTQAITVASQIPDFWHKQPRLWFHKFEAIVDPLKPSDLHRAQLLISKLGPHQLELISELLEEPTTAKRYETF